MVKRILARILGRVRTKRAQLLPPPSWTQYTTIGRPSGPFQTGFRAELSESRVNRPRSSLDRPEGDLTPLPTGKAFSGISQPKQLLEDHLLKISSVSV